MEIFDNVARCGCPSYQLYIYIIESPRECFFLASLMLIVSRPPACVLYHKRRGRSRVVYRD